MDAPTVVEHLVPAGHELGPVDLSIVVPALNERITVGEFVDWCSEGLSRARTTGQILIVDSSTDDTPQIALSRGAEVLRVPKRGLGRAYIDAIPFIRGKWVVMGDADLTYDFRDLEPFVAEFRKGAEFVMGSRFKGTIDKDAMPSLHRYFGTPLTTWILNAIYSSRYSDIHCGMRGLTREAMDKIQLRSQGWEYASEMVLKAARLKLRTAEVPVHFYRDREGRVSHHRRLGWISPWSAGWMNLKVMLVYSPDSFLLLPGALLFALGVVLSVPLGLSGPITLAGIGFNLHWMLFGLVCFILGYGSIQIAVIARIMHGLRTGVADVIRRHLTYNKGVGLSCILALVGLALVASLLGTYVHEDLKLQEISYRGIFGLMLIMAGFQTFGFTLLLEMSLRVLPGAQKK